MIKRSFPRVCAHTHTHTIEVKKTSNIYTNISGVYQNVKSPIEPLVVNIQLTLIQKFFASLVTMAQ